nr:hypothetical protein [Gammaproteobacteria bacterium]
MAKLRSKKEKNISPEEAEKIKGIKRDKLGMILKGSTALNEKYDKERAIGIFTDLTHRCIAGEFLSMQEAQMLSGVAHDTFYSLVKRFPEVAALKAQMNSAIVAKIYRGAME